MFTSCIRPPRGRSRWLCLSNLTVPQSHLGGSLKCRFRREVEWGLGFCIFNRPQARLAPLIFLLCSQWDPDSERKINCPAPMPGWLSLAGSARQLGAAVRASHGKQSSHFARHGGARLSQSPHLDTSFSLTFQITDSNFLVSVSSVAFF